MLYFQDNSNTNLMIANPMNKKIPIVKQKIDPFCSFYATEKF